MKTTQIHALDRIVITITPKQVKSIVPFPVEIACITLFYESIFVQQLTVFHFRSSLRLL